MASFTTMTERHLSLVFALIFLLATIAPGPATSVMLDQIAGPEE